MPFAVRVGWWRSWCLSVDEQSSVSSVDVEVVDVGAEGSGDA